MNFTPSLKEQLDILDRLILLAETAQIDLPTRERRALLAARGTVFVAEKSARVAPLEATAEGRS